MLRTYTQTVKLREGSLDVRYLAERYQRGVSKVDGWMKTHQRYEQVTELSFALPDFLGTMQNEGGDKLLVE